MYHRTLYYTMIHHTISLHTTQMKTEHTHPKASLANKAILACTSCPSTSAVGSASANPRAWASKNKKKQIESKRENGEEKVRRENDRKVDGKICRQKKGNSER